MDFNPSDLQRMLFDSAEALIGNRYTLDHRRALKNEPGGLDASAWADFADLGWLALAIPEHKGGLGGSLADAAVLMTAFGDKLVVDPYVSSAILACAILVQGDQTEALAAIASGQSRVALAHDEPGERYSVGTRTARLRAVENGYLLSGQKTLVLDAVSADRLIVTAGLAGEEGITLVLLDACAEGIEVKGYPLIDGSQAADIEFNDVVVTPDAIILPAGNGRATLTEAVDRASVALMAQAVGSMEACLKICSAYLKEREQFGQPIGKFQSLQHIMADMFVAAHQARSAMYQALAHSEAPAVERSRAVSLARITIDEASQLVSRAAIQLHGGYGVTDEYEVSHHYRRLLTLAKMYGDTDFHIRRLAELA